MAHFPEAVELCEIEAATVELSEVVLLVAQIRGEIKVAVELSEVWSLSPRSAARSKWPWVIGGCPRVAEIRGEIKVAVGLWSCTRCLRDLR